MKRWWQRRTLRLRLALWYAGGGTLLLTAFSFTLYTFVAQHMAQPLDHQLRQQLDEITRQLKVTTDSHILWANAAVPADPHWAPYDRWFELWDEHGKLVRRFWPFDDPNLQYLPIAPARGRETISVFFVAQDVRLRVLSAPYPVSGHPEGWMIRVLSIHEPLGDALGALRWIIVITLPVVVALLVFGGYLLTRRWLRPLDRMVAAATRISADDLSQRLPVIYAHDELGKLASVFNVTLDRLESAFVALDRFVADASHELRTPLTTLRSVGEVGLKRARSPEEYQEIIGSMLEEAQRLQLLTQRLLELATAEGGAQNSQRQPVQLEEFLTQCVGELSVLADYREQKISLGPAAGLVSTDPVLLRQALQNLLDNAIKHSPARTTIHVTLTEDDSAWTINVTDEGPGITPEHSARITERFYRADSSRSRTKGFGLGLALTKAYVRVLGGELTHTPAPVRGSTFSITLPK
jgi:two-component system OmpR family sensor kinase